MTRAGQEITRLWSNHDKLGWVPILMLKSSKLLFLLRKAAQNILSTTFFKQYANAYQFIYSTLFPKYFCRIDNDAIQSRCVFETVFVNFKVQKNGFNLNIKPENVINTTTSTKKKLKKKKIKNWIKKLRNVIKEKKTYWRSWWKHKKNDKIKINNIISIL